MAEPYFRRVAAQTPTRLWVNNPTLAEAARAIRAGAIGATTNPTYAARLLAQASAEERGRLLAEGLRATDTDAGVDAIQMRLVTALATVWAPLHATAGRGIAGLVSIQGNPHHDTDRSHILAEAARYGRLAENIILKIPVTEAGLAAIEELLLQGHAVLATEMMSVAQAHALVACAGRVRARRGSLPPLIATHITGIYDECLAAQAARLAPDLAPALVQSAGLLVARRVQAVLQASGTGIALMGGGARAPRHFTDMVGGPLQVTINPDMIEALERSDPPVASTFLAASDPAAITVLREQLPDFRCAWDDQGLRIEEFAAFGPVRHFLGLFIRGWDAVRQQLAALRAPAASTGVSA